MIYYYDVAFGSKMTSYNRIDTPQVAYRYSKKVMTSVTLLRTLCQNNKTFTTEMRFQSNLMSFD